MLRGLRTVGAKAQTITSREASVLAWGGNAQGQCAQSASPIVTEPSLVQGLGEDVIMLAAGKLSSAAVVDGQALTWGCGKAGKLGHAATQNFSQPTRRGHCMNSTGLPSVELDSGAVWPARQPCMALNSPELRTCRWRVEPLVGRCAVTAIALGHSHTLFLDSNGAVYSCGENQEGQCGYGTSLDDIAVQRRQEWALGAQAPMGGALRGRVAQQQASSGGGWQAADSSGASREGGGLAFGLGSQLLPFTDAQQRRTEVQQARRLLERQQSGQHASSSDDRRSRQQRALESAMLAAHGLMPGQSHTPARLGRDQHELTAERGDPGSLSAPGLEHERVTSIAASRYFSAAIADGQVWTFGGGFSGELGQESGSWVTAARPVEGEVAQAIADNGGAVAVETGGAFCICLTASGRVVLWGKLSSGRSAAPGSSPRIQPRVAEVMDLPRIRHIAAGHLHALLSDGERVWGLGRWLSAEGSKQVGSADWDKPEELLRLPTSGISSLAAGTHSSAAVSGDGNLWLWGRVLAKEHAKALWHHHSGSDSASPDMLQDENSASWSCMGADQPELVPGLTGVKQVVLGGIHGMALVDG